MIKDVALDADELEAFGRAYHLLTSKGYDLTVSVSRESGYRTATNIGLFYRRRRWYASSLPPRWTLSPDERVLMNTLGWYNQTSEDSDSEGGVWWYDRPAL